MRKRGGTAAFAHRRDVVPVPEVWLRSCEASDNWHRRQRTTVTAYPKPASGAPKFPDLELDVLDYWESDDTFRASVLRRDGAPEYVFYDGPPFANGLPHYGHLLTGYVKDIVPRYRTMRGYKVERRFG